MWNYFFMSILTVLCAACLSSGAAEKKEGEIASLTLFPVLMQGEPSLDVAQVLGLLLEKKGLGDIQISERAFKPSKEDSLEEQSKAFGAFLREHPISTEAALFAEFIGSPSEGVKEIRGLMVAKSGESLWMDRQTSEDSAFKKAGPDCPMACTVFVADRVAPLLDLSHPPKEGEGAMERLWAAKSNLPDKRELAALEERLHTFQEAGPAREVQIYPLRIGKKVDREGAKALAELLNHAGLCRAAVADGEPWFDIQPNSNEQRVLWDMAKAFREHCRQLPESQSYRLYADYLMNPETNRVGAVHFVVCDGKGDWVIVDFQNSHHPDFQKIAPDSLEECNRLLLRRLEALGQT